jgi:hypothetical protein
MRSSGRRLGRAALRLLLPAMLVLLSAAVAEAQQAPPDNGAVHLGVASCAGSNCHAARTQPVGSPIAQNEYLIWSTQDKHRNAYDVLLDARAVRMARALGYPDAVHQKICLDCHTDNVPPDRRGSQFQLSDGVGCEACHGGSSRWLGIHISGLGHQANLAAGLYPTEKPIARAELCLSCHFGDTDKFVNHRLIGAGHPRLGFELDTYTAIEPAHFVVNQAYIRRKGLITDAQVWAVGQALSLSDRMDALLSQRHGRMGIFPELVLFDCQSCHHEYNSLTAPRPTTSGLGPGTVQLNDANALMLRIIAERVAPGTARDLAVSMRALHQATTDDWAAVREDASAVRRAAAALAPELSSHQFTEGDLRALARVLITVGLNPNDISFEHAEQTTMGLEALFNDMRKAGYVDDRQAAAMQRALAGVYAAFGSEESYQPVAFRQALRGFQETLGR